MQILSSQKHNNYVSLEIHKIKYRYSHIKSWFTVCIPNYILGAILWFWMKALCDMWASLLTCWLREFCNNYQRFFFKNQNQTWKRMLPCNVHYNYCKMTLKLMIFLYIQHIDFWFLSQDQRKFMKELQQRILNQNCLLFSFKFVGLVNGFNALRTICLTFLFPYFLCKIDQ